jgi:phage terminase large subunit-like protein
VQEHSEFIRNTIIEHPELGLRLSKSSQAKGSFKLEGAPDTTLMARSWTGPVTSFGYTDIFVDDLLSGITEATNQATKNRKTQWLLADVFTRLEPRGNIVLVGTRWADDDPIGQIGASPFGATFTTHNFPAFAGPNDPLGRIEGEALFPSRFPVERLQEIETALGPYVFTACYQGKPTTGKGGAFKLDNAQYWTPSPLPGHVNVTIGDRQVTKRIVYRFTTVDLAISLKEIADWTVIATWDVTGDADLVLRDLHRARLEGPDQLPAIMRHHSLWGGGHIVHIEDTQFQRAVLQGAIRNAIPAEPLKAKGDKYTRSIPAQAMWAAGKVFLPAGAEWLIEY